MHHRLFILYIIIIVTTLVLIFIMFFLTTLLVVVVVIAQSSPIVMTIQRRPTTCKSNTATLEIAQNARKATYCPYFLFVRHLLPTHSPVFLWSWFDPFRTVKVIIYFLCNSKLCNRLSRHGKGSSNMS